MGRSRLAVFTTVYPAVEQYLAAWYQSVLAQTDHDFDLWIAVDSLPHESVYAAMRAETGSINLIAASGSPSQIRHSAIKSLVSNYAALVFVDSDDLLYPTRVESARSALESHDVTACALRIIDESGQDIGITFGLEDGEQLDELLPRYNVFGLSNTAYRSDTLKRCLPIGEQCELVDWLLATRAWAAGADLYFDREPHMAYRQYSSNIARVLLPFTGRHVLQATKRVVGHYSCTLSSQSELSAGCSGAIRAASERAIAFQRSITSSSETLELYVDELNRRSPRYVWWWCVAHPELEHIWKN